jgi:phage-related protein
LVGAFFALWNKSEAFRNFWIGLWDGIKSVVAGIGAWFSTVFTGAWEGIKSAFSAVGSFFSGIWDTITGIFTSIGTAVGDAIGGAFKAVVNAIIGFAESYINRFISAINLAIGVINAIPGVNIPVISELAIPRLAEGGIATGATLAMIGEGKEPEAVLPLSKLSAMLDTPTTNNSTTDEDCTVVFAPVQNFYGPVNRDDVEAANSASFAQFKAWYQKMKDDERRKAFVPA